ncbi:hypothetical protein GCM10027563_28980 [Parasphingorhabdus pacifica]
MINNSWPLPHTFGDPHAFSYLRKPIFRNAVSPNTPVSLVRGGYPCTHGDHSDVPRRSWATATRGNDPRRGGDPMTEAVTLMLLGSAAFAGILWTVWDIRTDLRRRNLD